MPYIDNPDAAQFLAGDACKAAGIDNATLKNWIHPDRRAILMSEDDRRAMGSGRAHLFTFRRVMQIALTAELVQLGFPPRKAGIMAAGFTDVGDGVAAFGDEIPPPTERLPGELYRDGYTMLVAFPDEDRGHIRKVVPKTTALELMFKQGAGQRSTAVLVNVSFVDRRVKAALGLPADWGRIRCTTE